MFFFAVYVHIFRGLYYGSYKAPREVLWILGVLIFLVMMATAFMGYVAALGPDELLGRHRHHQPLLVARQHLEGLGTTIVEWLWGGYSVVGHDAQPLLLAALPAALRDRRPRRACTSGRCTSPARTTRPASTSRPSRTPCRSPLRDLEGRGRHVRLPAALRLVRVLRAGLSRPRRQLHRRPTRW